MTKKMIIIGLTGGIGMGKSTAATLLRGYGLPVYDADQAVHALLAKNGPAVARVARLFPETLKRGAIDRQTLGRAVFNNPDRLNKLEKILHPLVRRAERTFLSQARKDKKPAAVLEIPLLFETGADKLCDVIFCVTAPRLLQNRRVMARPGMTKEKLRAIRARQMTDKERRSRADFVIPTGKGLVTTAHSLRRALASLTLAP